MVAAKNALSSNFFLTTLGRERETNSTSLHKLYIELHFCIDNRKNMWESPNYQSDGGESIDGSQLGNSSITSSIGIIGRKNLRAEAPAFRANNLDTYEDSGISSEHDQTYPTDFAPM